MIAIRRLLFVLLAIALGSGAMFFSSGSQGTPASATVSDVDFSISLSLADGDNSGCDSSGTPTAVCSVAAGQDFLVRVNLNRLPSALINGDYEGFEVHLNYTGVTFDGASGSVDMTPWPDCLGDAYTFGSGYVWVSCGVLLNPESTYTGLMGTVRLSCAGDGQITMVSNPSSYIRDGDNANEYSEAADESLTIDCVAPQAYPGDTDGDACPDAREQGTMVQMGGRRNFLNPWDWFDPTGDHAVHIDDILAVAMHYGKNAGQPGYDVKYDRTGLGPNLWNLGPPDGMIRSADINAIVRQYNAGCSTS